MSGFDNVPDRAIKSKEEFKCALVQLKNEGRFTEATTNLEMLRAQASAKGQRITATRLAEAIGVSYYGVANLNYGSFGRELAVKLNYEPPRRKDGTVRWFWTISTGIPASKSTLDGHYEYVMRPELYSALNELGWLS